MLRRRFLQRCHAGTLEAGGRHWFSCHFYDGTTPNGTSLLSIQLMH